MAEDKGFKPTQKRLDKARRDGRVLKSRVLTQSVVVCGALLSLILLCRFGWVRTEKVINYCFTEGSHNPLFCFKVATETVFFAVIGFLLAAALCAVLVEALQVGFRIEFAVLAPKADRLNPASGFRKIGSGLMKLPRFFAGLFIFVVLLFWYFGDLVPKVALSEFFSTEGRSAFAVGLLDKTLAIGAAFLLICGACDYLLQHRKFYRELSMSADDLRREHKDSEGDPHFKAMRKAIHESMAHEDLVKRVRGSRFVVVKTK